MSPVIFTLNQLHGRFLENQKGTYKYAPLKIILAKFVKMKDLDPLAANPEMEKLAFVEGA
jgi:hypothetical protein